MQPLVERAATVLRRVGDPALPISGLARLLEGSGGAVSEGVLRRALAAEPERFRLVEPWRSVPIRVPRGHGDTPPSRWETWVIPASEGLSAETRDGQRAALRQLRSTLVWLGWQVDRASSQDVARWSGMVLEAERFRRTLPGAGAADGITLAGGGGTATHRPRRRPLPPTPPLRPRGAPRATPPPASR